MTMTMADPSFLPSRGGRNWVRLRTLIYLRWLAVLGQTIAVILATQFFEIRLRLDLCGLLIILSALFNIGATLIHPETKRLSNRDAALTLLFDLAQLSLLLYVSGGLSNPFSVMILAQTIIAATVLTLRATMVLGAVTLVVITVLAVFHIPLMTASGALLMPHPLLMLGNWAALTISVVFFGLYARQISIETFSMSEALTATRLALEREQKLTALGGVVAAAAHELGTPLATIKLTSTELIEELADRPDLREDAELIRAQADRCRDILAAMGRSGKEDRHIRYAPFSAVVREAAAPHMDRGIRVVLQVRGAPQEVEPDDQPDIIRKPEIIHGLRNLVQNAVDFATSSVWIDLDWDDRHLMLRVSDDGRGYPPDLIGRIGDPFVRKRYGAKARDVQRPGYEGMGLGLFIAKTLLERTGAQLTFANGPASGEHAADHGQPIGAIVELVWDRSRLEIARSTSRGPLGDNATWENQS